MGTPPVMPPSHQMPPIMMGGGGVVIYHCKTHLNIDIYPCGKFFFENIGHKYDFEVGWGGGWSLSGSGGGPALRKQTFPTNLQFHIVYCAM